MQDFVISITNMEFSYNKEQPVLKDISLNIPIGKITAIMGSSGSGKTTVLRLISGQCKPQQGSIKVFGQDITKFDNNQIFELRKRMGMLFQFGALFTDMSVYENVAFTLKEHTNLPETLIKKIVAMKLHAVGLFGTQYMFPNELSGGMARRIALARAIALDPELMLYDEPFTGLDPISLNVIAMLIQRLGKALGQTSILVTHDIETTLKIADYIYFINSGNIIAHGSPNEFKHINNASIQQFLYGRTEGPFKYEYQTKLDYTAYLEQL
jgi:phospholipid/cholesterol/gamma-HCH transport system ATP-binding protein